MREKFLNLSIKRKITYLYLPLSIIPVIVFALVSTQLYETSIVNRSKGTMEDSNILIADRIESIIEDVESCATLLTISINNLYRNESISAKPVVDVFFDNAITNELAYSKLIFKDIDSIAYVDINNKIYFTDQGLDDNFSIYPGSEMKMKLMETTGNNIWFPMVRRGFLTKSSDRAIVTLGKKIWNIGTGETLGYLFINIDQSTFSELFNEQSSDYYIVDDSRQIVSSFEDEHVLKPIMGESLEKFLSASFPSDIISIENTNHIVSKKSIDRLDWTLVGMANYDHVTEDLKNLLLLSAIIVLIMIVLEISMSRVLNNLITNPILKLKQGLEKVSEGHFDVRFKMKSKDEIGVFAESFNHMSEEIQALLNKVEEEEKQKSAYEMALIQQQIKPHFLYNTLDIILKLSQMNQSKKAQKAVRKLADYYKGSLSGGADIISIEDEIKITKDYLELQKIRYSDLFEYKIDVDPFLLHYDIPKLTLQPLVENAIYHGLKYKDDIGTITIKGRVHDQGAYISIIDNGIGMDQEMANEIVKKREGHFGVFNVNHRLRLLFNGQSRLVYESMINAFTEARVEFDLNVSEKMKEAKNA